MNKKNSLLPLTLLISASALSAATSIGINFNASDASGAQVGSSTFGATWTDITSASGANASLNGGDSLKLDWSSSNTWSGGSWQGTSGPNSAISTMRVYLDDNDNLAAGYPSDMGVTTSDNIGVTVRISGLASWLAANSTTQYSITLILSTDTTITVFQDYTLRDGATTTSTALQTLSGPVRGDGTWDGTGLDSAGNSTVGSRGVLTFNSTDKDTVTLTVLKDATIDGVRKRGTVAGIIITALTDSGLTLNWNTTAEGAWNTTATNWLNVATPSAWVNGSKAVFSGATGYTVNIGTAITHTGITINDNGAWTFAGGTLAGTGGITKNGTGILTINTVNTFSGDVTLNNGSITINNGSALGTGALIVDRTSTGTFLHVNKPSATVEIGNDIQISGSASTYSVTQNGGNGLNFTGVISGGSANTVLRFYSGAQGDSTTRVKLFGENTFAGRITVERGSLVAGHEKAFGLALIDLYTNNNDTLGTLIFETGGIFTNNIQIRYLTPTFNTNDFDVTLSGIISRTGDGNGFRKIGTGTLTLTGDNTYTGPTNVVQGTLQLGSGGATGSAGVGGAITLATDTTLMVNRSGELAMDNVISGAGKLVKKGPGVLTLTGANTFTGGTTISEGTLAIGNNTALGHTSNIVLADGSADVVLQVNHTIALDTDPAARSTITFGENGTGTATIKLVNTANTDRWLRANITIPEGRTLKFDASSITGYEHIGGYVLNGSGNIIITSSNNQRLIFRDQTSFVSAANFTGDITIQANAVVEFRNGFSATTGNNVTVETGGRLNVIYQEPTIGGLNGAGNVIASSTLNATASNAIGLTLGKGNANGTFTGNISQLTALTKIGTGTQILAGANTYTGATTISGGTLQIGNGGADGTTNTAAITIAEGATLAFDRTGTLAAANAISGAGSVVKKGAGTVTLSGATSFTGALVVNSGVLELTNATKPAASSRLEIGSGASLNFGGTVTLNNANSSFAGRTKAGTPGTDLAGSLSLGGGHTLRVGSASSADILTLSQNLTLENVTLQYSFTGTLAHDTIAVGGTFAASGANTILLEPTSIVWGSDTYDLITVAGDTISDTELATFTLQGADDLDNAVARLIKSSDSTKLQLEIIAAGSNLVWAGTTSAPAWNNTDTNWTLSGSPQAFVDNDIANFDGTAEITDAVVGAVVKPFAINISGSADQSLTTTGSGQISGIARIIKTGTGTFTLSAETGAPLNDFDGNVTVNQGVLELTGGQRLLGNVGEASLLGSGSASTGTLSLDGGTLRFHGTVATSTNRNLTLGTEGGTLEVASNRVHFTAAGTVTQDGTGARTLTLGGDAGSGALGTTGTGTATEGGIFARTLADGTGGAALSVEKSGAGVWHLTGTNTFTGGVILAGGALAITADAALGAASGALTLDGGALVNAGTDETTLLQDTVAELTLNRAVQIGANGGAFRVLGSGTITLNGIVGDAGGTAGALEKYDTGTLALLGQNTFSGGLHVRQGTVTAGHLQATGTGLVTLESGTTLALNAAVVNVNGLAGAGTVQNQRVSATQLTLAGAGNATFSGVLANASGGAVLNVQKTGTGTQTLTGTSTYSGTTTVSEGILRITTAAALGTGATVNVASGGTLDIAGSALGTGKTIAISGSGTASQGALFDSTGGGSVAQITLGTASTLGTAGATALGNVSGTGNLTLIGTTSASAFNLNGTGAALTLNGQLIVETTLNSNTTGAIDVTSVRINGGTLALSANDAVSPVANLAFGDTGTLTLNASTSQEFAGLGGTGGSVTGAGTLVLNLSFASTYVGTIDGTANLTLENGELTLENAASTTSGIITARGTLTLDGALATSGSDLLGNATASSLVLENGILRSIHNGASTTTRTLTLGGIQSSLVSDSATGSLQFTGNGVVGFQPGVSDFTFTLDATGTGDNRFALDLTDPTGGTLTVHKAGTGRWTLTGHSSHTGGTVIENGTLALGVADALGSNGSVLLGSFANTSGTLDLNGYNQTLASLFVLGPGTQNRVINASAASSVLTLRTNGEATYTGALGNTGDISLGNFGLNKTGTGKLTLSGALAHTGATQVQEGQLVLQGTAQPLSSTFFVAPGAQLDVSGLSGGLVLGTGKTLTAGSDSLTTVDLRGNFSLNGGSLAVGTSSSTLPSHLLTLDGDLSATADSSLHYLFSSIPSGNNSRIKLNNLALNNTVTLYSTLTDGVLAPGTYSLIEYGTFSGDVSRLIFDDSVLDPRYVHEIEHDTVNKAILLTITSTSSQNPLQWVGSVESGGVAEWSGAVANFTQEGQAGLVSYLIGDTAYFGNDAVTFNVHAGVGANIGKVTFDNDTAHAYTVSGTIAGEGFLEKKGAGTLTLTGANTYRGELVDDVRKPGTILAQGTLAIGHNQALGMDTLLVTGGTLASAGNYTLANAVALYNGTQANFDSRTNTFTLNGTLTGDVAAQITKTGTGTLKLLGDASAFLGTIKHTSGTLLLGETMGDATGFANTTFTLEGAGATLGIDGLGNKTVRLGALAGDAGTLVTATTSGTKTFEIGALGTDTVFAGEFRDTTDFVALTKVGTGRLVLTGDNSGATGPVHVRGGTLQFGDGTSGQLAAGNLTVDTGATLTLNLPADFALTQTLINEGTVEKQGANTLTIASENAALGGTLRISEGLVRVADTGTLGTAALILDHLGDTLALDRTDDFNLANAISGAGTLVKNGSNTVTYLGEHTGTGVTRVENGTFALGDGVQVLQQSHLAALELVSTTSTLHLATAADGTATVGGVTGAGQIIKDGTGVGIITGAIQVTGGIQVQFGELHIGDGTGRNLLDVGGEIDVAPGAALVIARTGTTRFLEKVTIAGELRAQGDNNGAGTTLLAGTENQITGTAAIARRAVLQLGDASHAGRFNDGTAPLTINIDPRATLRFVNTGETTTGASIVISSVEYGQGVVEYAGTGALRLDSQTQGSDTAAAFNGTYLASNGTFIIPVENIVSGSTVNATSTGNLVIEAGANTTFAPKLGTGTGTVTLAAREGSAVQYELTNAPATPGILAVGAGATLHFTKTLNQAGQTALSAATLLVQNDAWLTGNGTLQGNLVNRAGGTIKPGNSVGQINLVGDFVNDGHLAIDFDSPTSYSTIHYTGTAYINSTTAGVQLKLPQAVYDTLASGTQIKFLVDDDTADGLPSVVGNFSASNITLALTQTDGSVVVLANQMLAYNQGDGGITLLFANDISDIGGLKLHDGLAGYAAYLSAILQDPDAPAGLVATVSDLLGANDVSKAVNAASPIGFSSMTAMSISMAWNDTATLHSHLESLRYGRSQYGAVVNAQPYFTGTGTFVQNGGGSSDPAFDFNTYGGLIGFDQSIGQDIIVGANVGYHHGKADLEYGSGSIKQNNVRFNLYGSLMLSDYLYVDAGVFGGYSSYEIEHLSHPTQPAATAEPEGFDIGGSLFVGGVVPVTPGFHLTPYVGVEYVHAKVDAFTETGNSAALHVDGFNQDSLRAKIGTGFNWLIPTQADFSLRLGLDLAYAYEFLDTDAEINARFASDTSGRRYTINAASTPEHSLQVGPSLELGIDENKTFLLSYRYEHDLDNQSAHHLNASFRMRF